MNRKNFIVDFHTHLFPPEVRENREKYFAGEPAFELLYTSPKSKMIGAPGGASGIRIAHAGQSQVIFQFFLNGYMGKPMQELPIPGHRFFIEF